ncbi:flagellar biosynthesis protein FlhB [Desulfoplanes formicivorans]|uniref:Flagellar biosynthetic protein FlhB n=1 Tax=Desulfoplanes formicivorans TaxID=1592317 RepID=A0A194AII7_9BACT|nr:flagellar biosynthesis protein FlhB [Desulfoplanes formicivorans]GAU09045.1 flagellar biosynthesis protein FlhB [Desulfoplanes formicivorans]
MPQKDPSKTEKATPKRRKKAREEGNVPKSQELSKSVLLIGGVLALYVTIGFYYQQISSLMRWFLGPGMQTSFTQGNVYNMFIQVSKALAMMLLPTLLFLALISFLVMRLQVGQLWSSKILKPKFKFNLLQGIKRMFFDVQTIARLLKSILMAAAVAVAPYLILKSEFFKLAPLFYQPPEAIAVHMLSVGAKMALYALVPMTIIGIGDLIYTRWDYEQNLKMTKDEIKDEHKQAEGDPKIKNQQKQKMLAVSRQRMMQKVPEADVIITNPTHLALAIRYKPSEAPAPLILAKGADRVAQRIKDIAREHGIPIRENKPLARALYKTVEVGDMIPEEMFQAVAAILAQVYSARNRN